MIAPVRWILAGVIAYLIFLVATFPAATAYRWFAPAGIVLVAPSGTVWSGQAAGGSVAGLTLSDPQWRLRPWSLLLGRATGSVETRMADGFASSDFSASFGGRVDLEATRLSTNIQALAGLLPVYDTRGQISVSMDTLSLVDGWPTNAAGEVRVGNLEVAPLLPTATGAHIPLGNFVATIRSADGAIVADLADASGPLELDGRLTVREDRSYLLDARLRARPEASPDLRQGIELMTGEPDSSGMREMTLSGSL